MKRFACGDVVAGCTWTMQVSDEADLMALIADHAAVAHGITTLDDELIAVVREHIQLVS
jgi:predicted small metal-binding protein